MTTCPSKHRLCNFFLSWLVKNLDVLSWTSYMKLPTFFHVWEPLILTSCLSFHFAQVPTEFFIICKNSLYMKDSRSLCGVWSHTSPFVFHLWFVGIWEPFLFAESFCFYFTWLFHFHFFFLNFCLRKFLTPNFITLTQF